MIFGIFGACRSDEFVSLMVEHVKRHGDILLVSIVDTKTGVNRSFTVSDKYYAIVQKYINLRPRKVLTTRFFLNYQKGKCSHK